LIGTSATDEMTKTGLCQEKTPFRITAEPTVLALRNQTICPGFLWYLAPSSGKDYRALVFILHPPNPCKCARCNLLFF
jgi:hypothetical protein